MLSFLVLFIVAALASAGGIVIGAAIARRVFGAATEQSRRLITNVVDANEILRNENERLRNGEPNTLTVPELRLWLEAADKNTGDM